MPPVYVNVKYLERLLERLDLSEVPTKANPFILPRIIVPVTQADDLLKTLDIHKTGNVDPGAAGNYTAITIPTGERWRIYQVFMERQSGDGTINAFLLKDKDNHLITIKTQTAATTMGLEYPMPLEVGEDWELIMGIAAWTNGNVSMDVLCEKMEAY